MYEREVARAVARDSRANPVALLAVTRAMEGGESALQDFIRGDIARYLRGERNVVFPTAGFWVREAARAQAGLSAGMGALPIGSLPTAGVVTQAGTTTAATAATTPAFDWGGLIGSVVTAGTTIYANRQQYEADRKLLKLQQPPQVTVQQQGQADMMISAAGGGLPGWVLPLGIGAVLLIGGYFMFMR